MKKIYAFIFIAIIGIVVFACSREGTETRQQQRMEQAAFDDLNAQIALLNVQYADRFSQDTRGRFWRWLGIFFGCDAGGAAVGSLIAPGAGTIVGGIWGSLMSLFFMNATVAPQDDVYITDITEVAVAAEGEVSTPQEYNAADSVGYLHNKIISEIFNEYGEDAIYSLSTSALQTVILNKVEGYCGKITDLDMNQLSLIYSDAEKVAENFCDPNITDPYAIFEEIAPGRTAEVNILKAYCESLSQLSSDEELVKAYTHSFDELIRTSEISQQSKEFLSSCVNVGGSSCLLWQASVLEAQASDNNQ